MGAGASAQAQEEWDDVPINKADLQTDGKVDQRISQQALADQMSFSNDFGRLSVQSKLAEDPYAVSEAEALRAQAAAHWHRIISHTRDQRAAAADAGEEVPCPLCGQMTEDPKFCGFCGDVEEATQELLRAQDLAAEQALLQQEREEDARAALAAQGSPGSSASRLLAPLGSFIGSTMSLLGIRDAGAGSGSDTGSPSSGSPSHNSSFRRSFVTDSKGSPISRGKGSSLIDLDAEKQDMEGVLGTLLEGSLAARNRGKGAEGASKSAQSLRARLAELEQEEADMDAREERAAAALAERERLNAVKRFVGMGLDSDTESDEDVDEETRKLKKQLKELEKNGHISDDEDDSEAEGATSWERSPFYRLLNANTIAATKEKYGIGKKLKNAIDAYDAEDEARDLEKVGEAPDPPLPPVQVMLKRRDAKSVGLVWDATVESMQILEAVRQAYGKRKNPIYQVQYRKHANSEQPHELRREDSGVGGSTKSMNGGGGSDPDKDWKIGIKSTGQCGGTVTGLQPNTAYQFRCRRVGWCPNWEAAVPVVIRSGPGAPSVPRTLAAREVSSTSILLTWQVPDKDNGLPVHEYVVHMKKYGKQTFEKVYTGRERCHLSIHLESNLVHVFQVQAVNKAGRSGMSERLAIRTLPPGAASVSPWVEVVDERAHKVFFCHTKTNAIAWKLPEGGILDEAGSFKNKRTYLINQMEKRSAQACAQYGVAMRPLQIKVDRKHLLEASLRILHHAAPDEMEQGPIRVQFEGEDGLDAGGLAKDWFIEVSNHLIQDSTGLLAVNEDTGYVTIDQRSASIHSVAESARLFRAVGRFFGKAIIDGQTLGVNLDPLLLCLMGGREPRLDAPGEGITIGSEDASAAAEANVGSINRQGILQLTEPLYYKGLKWVQNNDVTYADLTFTVSYELFDESQTVELVPYGHQCPVTEENKGEYVRLMTNWLLKDRYEPALSSFMEGFTQHINVFKHMRLFSLSELQLLIGGVPDIDVKELVQDATFGGFVSKSDQVEWLFSLLEEFDHEKLSKFLGFVSGCCCMPVDGLRPPLLITRMEDGTDQSLPKAHTCFNQIVIPRYSSPEVLKNKLLYALENASAGFFIS